MQDMPMSELIRIIAQPKWGGLKVSESAIRGYMKRYDIPRPSERRGARAIMYVAARMGARYRCWRVAV